MNKLLNYIFILCTGAVFGDFPDSVNKCHNGDNDCLKETTQEVLKKYSNGLSELNLIPFDPLHVKSLTLKRNPSSPVNLELKFKELDLIGLKKAQVKEVKGLNFTDRNVFEAFVPEFILKGKYRADGRVLFLPITGKGNCVITCKNLHLRYTFDLTSVEKNDKVYAQLNHVKLEFKPEHVQYQLDDLFSGDKALGDNMNKFLNENWRDIYNELEGSMAKAIGLLIKQMINNIISEYPFEDLFLK